MYVYMCIYVYVYVCMCACVCIYISYKGEITTSSVCLFFTLLINHYPVFAVQKGFTILM